jgi:hypothetical protein
VADAASDRATSNAGLVHSISGFSYASDAAAQLALPR